MFKETFFSLKHFAYFTIYLMVIQEDTFYMVFLGDAGLSHKLLV